MRKKSVLAVVSIIGLSSFVVLGSSPGLVDRIISSVQNYSITKIFSSSAPKSHGDKLEKTGQATVSHGNGPVKTSKDFTHQVPEVVLWRVIFSFPEKLEKMANQARQEGQDDSLWTGFFTRQVGLSGEDSRIFADKAKDFSSEIATISERTEKIIEDFKAKNPQPNGKDEKSGRSFNPSAEFITLQKQKDEITFRYRDDLRAAIGEETFSKFDEWLKGDFAKSFEISTESSMNDKNSSRQVENKGFTPFNEMQKREINLEEGKNK